MANVNSPFGFKPLMRGIAGGPASVLQVNKLVGYGTALFIGDPVCKVGSGTKSYPTVSAAITPGTTPVFGVNLIYGAASKATDHLIIPATGQVFLVQCNGTANLAASNINNNANMASGTGSSVTLLSGWVLDTNTFNTTNTLDLKIVQMFQGTQTGQDNALGQYARVEVIFNNTAEREQVAGA